MKVRNEHRRFLAAATGELAPLIDGLSSREDPLWPHDRWPPMRFDRPLGAGAKGGHGPIRYWVEGYEPGRSIVFRFTAPVGFHGMHRIDLEHLDPAHSLLSHRIEMETAGLASVKWHLVIRPLHDALVEDALDRAEIFAGAAPPQRTWSPWVKFLRRLLRKVR